MMETLYVTGAWILISFSLAAGMGLAIYLWFAARSSGSRGKLMLAGFAVPFGGAAFGMWRLARSGSIPELAPWATCLQGVMALSNFALVWGLTVLTQWARKRIDP